MAEDVVTRAEQAYAGLTKGEWKVSPPISKTFPGNYWSIGTANDELVERFTGECASAEGDAQFFVKSTVLVPGLVAEVKQLREKLIDAETKPERSVEEYLKLRYADDPVEAFNLFIKTWVHPRWHAHLLDDDENDAEFVRNHIRDAIEQAEER